MNSQNTTPKRKESEDDTWPIIFLVLIVLTILSGLFDKSGLVFGWILIGLGAILTIISFVLLARNFMKIEKSKLSFPDYAEITLIFLIWGAIIAIPIIGIFNSFYFPVIQLNFIAKGIRMLGLIITGLLIISNSILSFRYLNSFHKTVRPFESKRFDNWIIENTWIVIIFELVFVVAGLLCVLYTFPTF